MATLYVSSAENPHSSSGNSGTFADPMGVQEAFAAAAAGDEIRIMDDGAYNITATLTLSVSGTATSLIKVFGANGSGTVDGSIPHLNAANHNSNVQLFTPGSTNHYYFKNLKLNDRFSNCFQTGPGFSIFENLHADASQAAIMFNSLQRPLIVGCTKQGGFNSSTLITAGLQRSPTLIGCAVSNGGPLIAGAMGFQDGAILHKCLAVGATIGFDLDMHGQSGLSVTDCVAYNCTGDGFRIDNRDVISATGNSIVARCIAHGNGGDGFAILSTSSVVHAYSFEDLIATENGGYGFNNLAGNSKAFLRGNFARNNTSGSVSGTLFGESVVDLTADPFVDPDNGDFEINDTAGGGAVLRAYQRGIGAWAGSYPFRSLVGTLGGGGGGGTRAWWG